MRRRLMNLALVREPNAPSPAWTDTRLVCACLDGNEQAWAALIEKYKRLIYSIPRKYHATPEDAADIFQAVCLELFSELAKLRKTESLRSWLITVAIRKSWQWKMKKQRSVDRELNEVGEPLDPDQLPQPRSLAPELVQEAERDQMVREALARLGGRCQEMIRLLFYKQPPLPYDEVAQHLGLATGSIGFIRGRCLKRLEKLLREMGLH